MTATPDLFASAEAPITQPAHPHQSQIPYAGFHDTEYQLVSELIDVVTEELEQELHLHSAISRFMLVLKMFHRIDARAGFRKPTPDQPVYHEFRAMLSNLRGLGLALLMAVQRAEKECREDMTKFAGVRYEAFKACIEELEMEEHAFLTGYTDETAAADLKRIFG